MVESSGGVGCRCVCQDDYDATEDSGDPPQGCCSPQIFTSILLGILACVLMTGGVFLAFHRWDPMWLMVSGVGVVLVLIGSILHCCNNGGTRTGSRRHSAPAKGCCCRPTQPDHLHTHMITNNGSLTEQLLPLSNARSVSQLSLNMLPGYFPPVVTAYGIEQHSTVVQNINRIVQQQQQPQTPGSTTSGLSNGPGKSFILLSLPGETTPANIQNLVATVYQLDGNVLSETPAPDTTPQTPPVANSQRSTSTTSLILRNVEVQTCNIWPTSVPNPVPHASGEALAPVPSTSGMSTECLNVHAEVQRSSTATASGATQTVDSNTIVNAINLMDCSTEISSICDNTTSACDSQSTNHNTLVNIPVASSDVLVDVSEPSTSVHVPENTEAPVDIPEPSSSSLLNLEASASCALIDVAGPSTSVLPDIPQTDSAVLVDISESNCNHVSSNSTVSGSDNLSRNEITTGDLQVENHTAIQDSLHASSGNTESELAQINADISGALPLDALNSELSSSSGNLSAVDVDVDDSELLERSSPPPSYEDVTLEGENAIGAFGLAYGTI